MGKKSKIQCVKCWVSDSDSRYLMIKTSIDKYIFCDKCAYDGYMLLFSKPNKTEDEIKLFKQLGKFIAN